MNCPRCLGLLLPVASLRHEATDYIVDAVDVGTDHGAWKCSACGEILDPVILRNRAVQADAHRLVAQAESVATVHALSLEEAWLDA